MPKFRKKPVVIEARLVTEDNLDEIVQWIEDGGTEVQTHGPMGDRGETIKLHTPRYRTADGNWAHIWVDHWVIKGVQGEFYPCKPDIFETTYEVVRDDPTAPAMTLEEQIDLAANEYLRAAIMFGDLSTRVLFVTSGELHAALRKKLDGMGLQRVGVEFAPDPLAETLAFGWGNRS